MWYGTFSRAFQNTVKCRWLAGGFFAASFPSKSLCKAEGNARTAHHIPSVRVLQYNIECDTEAARKSAHETNRSIWPQRQNLVFNVIKEQSPDLIGFQETVPHQCIDLQNMLEKEGYAVGFVVFGSLMYALKLSGAGPLAGWHITQRGDADFYSPLFPHGFLWVAIEGPNNGRLLFVVTHYHHLTDEEGEKTREASSRQLAAFLQSPRWRDWPQIVVGDFNAEPGALAHRALVNDSSLVDSYMECHPQDSRRPVTYHKYLGKSFEPPAKWVQSAWPQSLGPGGIKTCHIDWVLHSRSLEALSCDILSDYSAASDHFPVLGVLQGKADKAPEPHADCVNSISDVEALERLWRIARSEFWVMDRNQYDVVKCAQSRNAGCSIGRQLLAEFQCTEFESKKANHPGHEMHMFAASYMQKKAQLLREASSF